MSVKVAPVEFEARRKRLISLGLTRDPELVAVPASTPKPSVTFADDLNPSTNVIANKQPVTDPMNEVPTIHLSDELSRFNSVKKSRKTSSSAIRRSAL